MSDIVDLFSAVQQAAYDLLAGAADAGTVPVYSTVPQDAPFPYRVIADLDSDDETPRGVGQLERITFEIHTWYRGRSRAELLALMHRGRLAIQGGELLALGAELSDARFLKASVSRAAPVDGVTYVGVQLFETLAQPAD